MAFKQEAFAFSMGSTLSVRKCSRALRKRTTCLVSSVSFVSRFLPMNKPGLHPPAAARHPSSKHKARCSSSRDAGKLDATLSSCLSASLFLSLPLFFSRVRSVLVLLALSFARDGRLLRIVRFDLRQASAIPCSPFPRLYTVSSISHKEASCVFSEICRALVS